MPPTPRRTVRQLGGRLLMPSVVYVLSAAISQAPLGVTFTSAPPRCAGHCRRFYRAVAGGTHCSAPESAVKSFEIEQKRNSSSFILLVCTLFYTVRYVWLVIMSRRRGRTLCDTAIRPSVPWRNCRRRSATLGYRHSGCLQLSHVRTADPSADGRRSAASRTAFGGAYRLAAPGAITFFSLASLAPGAKDY